MSDEQQTNYSFFAFMVETGVTSSVDDDGNFEAFVIVQAVGEDGSAHVTGQMPPDALRDMAFHFLAGAETADRAALAMTLLVSDLGMDPDTAQEIIRARQNDG